MSTKDFTVSQKYPVPHTGVSGVISSAGMFRVTPLRGEPPNTGLLFTVGSGFQMPVYESCKRSACVRVPGTVLGAGRAAVTSPRPSPRGAERQRECHARFPRVTGQGR